MATAIAELKTRRTLHLCRATPAQSGAFLIHSPFFSEYRRKSQIRHQRDFGPWRSISDAPTSVLGQIFVHEIYCSLPNFGRSEQEHEHMGSENKSAKYGLAAYQDQFKLQLRACAGKFQTEKQTVRELIKGWVPGLPYHRQFGPIVP